MDRFREDLEIELASYSIHDDYNEDEDEMVGDYEEEEEEEEQVNDVENVEKSDELACPFCTDDFDVLGLCCHIDADHRMEVKPGICPVCTAKVRINMASHVISQHESILKALCNKGNHSTRSALYLLRKELQEKHLRSIKESPCVHSSASSDVAADTMLMSFVNNPNPAYRPQTVGPAAAAASTEEASLSGKCFNDDSSQRTQPSVSANRNNESARRKDHCQMML